MHWKMRVNYYPFGLTISEDAGVVTTTQPYKYQSIELNKDFGLETYETKYRDLDPQIGRFKQIDSKAENHYDVSPFASMGNNPALNADPLGDDWFVDNKTGNVLFLKGQSEVSENAMKNTMYGRLWGKAEDYERLGPDNMFGNKVPLNNYGTDALSLKAVYIENPDLFMKNHGYAKAERVRIKEREFVSGGNFGGEERISQTVTDLKQVGESKITYTKPAKLNTKQIIDRNSAKSNWSSSKSVLYNLTKPYGQSNSKTAEYYGNKNHDYSSGISLIGSLIETAKAIFKK